MTGSLYIVSTPIGHPDDLSLRAISTLKTVAVIAAEDPQRTQALLARHGIATPLTSYHNDNKEEKIPVLLQRMREGQSVVLVSDAGTPAIVDPGTLLIREALRQNISVVTVPGPSALLAALSASGLPGDAFTFIGSLPLRSTACRARLHSLRLEPRTIVCFETPQRLPPTLKMLRSELGNRQLVLACDLTTPRERFLRGTVDEIIRMLAARAVQGEVTLVIGGAQPRQTTRGKRKKKRRSIRSVS
jgi:16S rRNA (cytidine1402-2'-O)-methyltransferase